MDVPEGKFTSDNFVRIDYSATVVEVFASLTMYLLRRDRSLAVIECFGGAMAHKYETDCPSWVVDWRYVEDEDRSRVLDWRRAEDRDRFRARGTASSRNASYSHWRIDHGASGSSHPWLATFFYDNRDAQETSCLRLRGLVQEDSPEVGYVYREYQPQQGDIIVRFLVAERLCILRPVSGAKFRLQRFIDSNTGQSLLSKTASLGRFEMNHWERSYLENLKDFIIV